MARTREPLSAREVLENELMQKEDQFDELRDVERYLEDTVDTLKEFNSPDFKEVLSVNKKTLTKIRASVKKLDREIDALEDKLSAMELADCEHDHLTCSHCGRKRAKDRWVADPSGAEKDNVLRGRKQKTTARRRTRR
jgi:hypothetical protein